jgi:hypothetical protein
MTQYIFIIFNHLEIRDWSEFISGGGFFPAMDRGGGAFSQIPTGWGITKSVFYQTLIFFKSIYVFSNMLQMTYRANL